MCLHISAYKSVSVHVILTCSVCTVYGPATSFVVLKVTKLSSTVNLAILVFFKFIIC